MSMVTNSRPSGGVEDPDMRKYELVFKVLLVGDMGVGKTTLLESFAEKEFNPHKTSSIRTDYKLRSLNVQGNPVRLHIWDAAGHDSHRTLTSQFYRDAHGALIVYDITKKESFNNLDQWFQVLDRSCGKELPKVLIGNTNDLDKYKRDVNAEEGAEYSRNLGKLKPPFLEISAMNEQDAENAFVMLVNEILSSPLYSSQAAVRDSIILKKNDKPIQDPKESGCCK